MASEEVDWDLEEGYASDGQGYVLGAQDEKFANFSSLPMRPDHPNRPLWVCPDGRIFLETFSRVYKQAYDFLIACAEPVSRPEFIHEYALTPHSLYAAVSIGLDTPTIVGVLGRLSKCGLPAEVRAFIEASTENYGKVKLVLQRNAFFVESPYPAVLRRLLHDPVIRASRVLRAADDCFEVSAAVRDAAAATLAKTDVEAGGEEAEEGRGGGEAAGPDGAGASARGPSQGEAPAAPAGPAYLIDPVEIDPDRELHAFEIEAAQVEHVKQRCLPGGLNYPMLEEYDFRGDVANPTLSMELRPHVSHRPYQEKSLAKMFGNGRARSGIIVLPCGAGKSLVGVSAAARMKKSCLVLCTNAVSVDQWKYQFQMWTSLRDDQMCRFTSANHEWFAAAAGVCVTTYTMVAYSGRRSEESENVMNEIMNREWGLIILDEVHVVPAQMFRKVIGIVKAHCKLGLTATLVREDHLITDLNFLIGPKLYEANWLDLTRAGHIANVQCAEVWCPMTREFYREYLRPGTPVTQRQLLYVMNPSKLQACQFLVQYHERRGDKVIVFSDNIYALREYAVRMKRPFIYGATGHQERTRILHAFKHNPEVNTVFLSKVGDNSLDIPEANVLVQISSHAGSRRQEAQRLGRILRKKKARLGVGEAEEFDAFFYTLVSNDTQEVYFTSKRQQFLVDQGYSYKVIPSLLENAGGEEGLLLSSLDEQLDVLAAILAANETDIGDENLAEVDGVPLRKSGAARRTAGNMAALSGAAGMRYMEFAAGAGRPRPALKQGQGRLAKLRKKG
uniref:DNA 3'-5' helicase n=1 Tax=Auxenochlorella protothecoides TaxID=3075 RepID=A0A1D2AEI6_AUXPR